LRDFLIEVYANLDPQDSARFAKEQRQDLDEWFSLEEMLKYGVHGSLIEARNNEGKLVGALYIGMDNPMTWPDGKKAEIFILGTLPTERGKGVGTKLMKEAEEVARKMDAKKIMVNTHVLMEADHRFYTHRGYVQMGVLKEYYGNGDAVFFSKNLAD